MECEGHRGVQAVLGTEQRDEPELGNQRARQVLRAHVFVERRGHVVLDAVPEPDQQLEVQGGVLVQRALVALDARGQLPPLEALTVRSSFELAARVLLVLVEVPDLHSVLSVVGVHQVSPRDDHEDDERLGLELDERVVVGLDGREGGLTRLR